MCASLLLVALAITGASGETAGDLVAAGGVRAGLCIHLGVTDGRLTAELGRSGKFVVHGLADDAAAVESARRHIREAGLYGRVSVEQGTCAKLPYAEGLVNLVVVSTAAKDANAKEVARILAPNGAACFEGAVREVPGLKPLKAAGGWSIFTKPLPAGSAEWTHQNVSPSGNRVSPDTLAGPPQRLRWLAGVEWTMPDYAAKAMVVGGGRVYYVINEAPARKQSWPYLSARDAFSGVLLWKKAGSPNPLTMIAAGERLYLGLAQKFVAVDGATGTELKVYDEAPEPVWAMLAGDRLLVACRGGSELRCLDPVTGALRWKGPAGRSFEPGGGLPNAAVEGGTVLYVERRKGTIGCLDLATGAEKWHRDASADLGGEKNATLASCQGETLVVATGKGIAAFSTKDGRHLWSHRYEVLGTPTRRKAKCYRDGFFIDGLYWVHVGGVDPSQPEKYRYERGRKWSWQGLDPATGKVTKTLSYPAGVEVGASCFPDQATVRWFMGGYSDFVETATGKYHPRAIGLHSSCGIGVRVAYGLLYNSALYMPGRFLQGDMAVEGGQEERPLAPEDPARIEKGPAYGNVRGADAGSGADDQWPIHRHDGLRTSRTTSSVPAELAELWTADAGASPSAPTIAGGRAFVASAEEHRVSAFDASSGKPLWSFTAGGRVKVPPSVGGNLCLFGSADGHVYCLEAGSGKLVWRFRAARTERRIVARERVESTWPVDEGVLLRNGLACFAAGRHGQVDGGIDLYVLEAASGKVVWHNRWGGSGYPPLLTTDGETLALSSSSRYGLKTGVKSARLELPAAAYDRCAIDPAYVIGKAATLPVRLRALARAGETVFAAGRPAGGLSGDPAILWQRPRKEAEVADAPEVHPLDKSKPAPADWRLWAFSAADGKKLAELTLPAEPSWDTLAAAGGRLYLATEDGKLRCFGKR